MTYDSIHVEFEAGNGAKMGQFLRNKDKFKGWKVEWIMRPRYRVKGMDGIEDTLR